MTDQSRPAVWPQLRAALDVGVSVAMLGAAVFMAWGASNKPEATSSRRALAVPQRPVRLVDAPVLGSPGAPVALLAFSDFECPFCSRFTKDVLPMLKQKYIASGKVQLVFRHLPLPIHQNARAAAQAAECAGRQNKFWPMHDRLFKDPSRLGGSDLRQYASEQGLDLDAFDSCLVQDADVTRRIQDDYDLARSLGIVATPSFFLGTVQPRGQLKVVEVIAGARPADHFVEALERVLGPR